MLGAVASSASFSLVGALSERLPEQLRVELKRDGNQVGVWIRGQVDLHCYRERDIVVERLENQTRITPRFRTTSPEGCRGKIEPIFEKIADLDPALPSSNQVWVLGFEGWTLAEQP